MTLLRYGSHGAAVKDLQRRLIKAGYPVGRYGADGAFGAATLAAVRRFQAKKGWPLTGSSAPAPGPPSPAANPPPCPGRRPAAFPARRWPAWPTTWSPVATWAANTPAMCSGARRTTSATPRPGTGSTAANSSS